MDKAFFVKAFLSFFQGLSRCVFSNTFLVKLYKSQVLSYVEYATPALYHAPRFFLQRLDNIQDDFLSSLGLTATTALDLYHLCPLCTRRDIAMLGLIHRTVLGKGPPQFRRYFHPGSTAAFPRTVRSPDMRHNHQLRDRIDGSESNALRRSALSLVYPYNLLPAEVVAKGKVNMFQRALQVAVKQCETGLQAGIAIGSSY